MPSPDFLKREKTVKAFEEGGGEQKAASDLLGIPA